MVFTSQMAHSGCAGLFPNHKTDGFSTSYRNGSRAFVKTRPSSCPRLPLPAITEDFNDLPAATFGASSARWYEDRCVMQMKWCWKLQTYKTANSIDLTNAPARPNIRPYFRRERWNFDELQKDARESRRSRRQRHPELKMEKLHDLEQEMDCSYIPLKRLSPNNQTKKLYLIPRSEPAPTPDTFQTIFTVRPDDSHPSESSQWHQSEGWECVSATTDDDWEVLSNCSGMSDFSIVGKNADEPAAYASVARISTISRSLFRPIQLHTTNSFRTGFRTAMQPHHLYHETPGNRLHSGCQKSTVSLDFNISESKVHGEQRRWRKANAKQKRKKLRTKQIGRQHEYNRSKGKLGVQQRIFM